MVLRKMGVPEVMVEIVQSFHSDMKARVRLEGELLEEIEVNNGLRQGCTMASSLFNLYACAVAERWTERVKDVEEVGTEILYKLDQHLFRRSTRKASKACLLKGEFADDVVLMARSRDAAAAALRAYVDVARDFGMTVSVPKTKFTVVGCAVTEEEKAPIAADNDLIEWVSEFPFLGSLIADSGRMDVEQAGAVQCDKCERWFRSRGGLAVHACRREEEQQSEEQPYGATMAATGVTCVECGRNFRRPGDLKWHKCLQEGQKPMKDQQGSVQCVLCQRWFRSAGGLAVHLRTHNPQPS